jgi:hypothetical protein
MSQDDEGVPDSSPSSPLTGEFNALDDMSPANERTAEAELERANLELGKFGDSLSPSTENGYSLKRSNGDSAYFERMDDAEAAVERVVALETLERRVVQEDLSIDESTKLNELGSWWDAVSKTRP